MARLPQKRLQKYTREGVRSVVKKTKLKNKLLQSVDSDNPIEVEKVERYMVLWETYTELAKSAKDNPMVTVKNGAQEYTKTNPAVNDMNRINASLIALGKDMGLDDPQDTVETASGGLI